MVGQIVSNHAKYCKVPSGHLVKSYSCARVKTAYLRNPEEGLYKPDQGHTRANLAERELLSSRSGVVWYRVYDHKLEKCDAYSKNISLQTKNHVSFLTFARGAHVVLTRA